MEGRESVLVERVETGRGRKRFAGGGKGLGRERGMKRKLT